MVQQIEHEQNTSSTEHGTKVASSSSGKPNRVLASNEGASGSFDYSMYDLEQNELKVRSKSSKRTIVILLIVAILVLGAAGWFAWNTMRMPDISAYAEEPVSLIGLEDETVTITASEIMDMDYSSISATGISDKSGQADIEKTAIGYGVPLNSILEPYGYTVDDFRRIVVNCRDGYQIAILPDSTLEGDVYVVVTKGSDPLPENMQPMRLIMPSMVPGQWVYCIESFTFEKKG